MTAGEEATEQLRNLFGERGRHPYADRIEAEELAVGKPPKHELRLGALGRRVTATGFDLVLRLQPTVHLLWALGDEETRREGPLTAVVDTLIRAADTIGVPLADLVCE